MPRLTPALAPELQKQVSDLGGRLKALRISKGLSTVAFARDLGITRVTLARMERGDAGTSLGVYASAMHLLGVSADLRQLVSKPIQVKPVKVEVAVRDTLSQMASLPTELL